MYSKMFFPFERIKHKMWSLRIFIDGILSKWMITLFQEVIASGKKLFMYLEERHLISWNVLLLLLLLLLLFWLYKGLRCRGSLSLRLGVLYSQPCVSVECAYTNDVQIRFPILIPHRVLNGLNLAALLLGVDFFQPFPLDQLESYQIDGIWYIMSQ